MGGQRSSALECLSSFFGELVPPETLESLLLEAEEYAANAIRVGFDYECAGALLSGVSATILYTPHAVSRIIVEVRLSPEVSAREFVERVYGSLLAKSCYVGLSTEGIYVARRVGCPRAAEVRFRDVVSEILEEVGEECSLRFSGSYELSWYVDER